MAVQVVQLLSEHAWPLATVIALLVLRTPARTAADHPGLCWNWLLKRQGVPEARRQHSRPHVPFSTNRSSKRRAPCKGDVLWCTGACLVLALVIVCVFLLLLAALTFYAASKISTKSIKVGFWYKSITFGIGIESHPSTSCNERLFDRRGT